MEDSSRTRKACLELLNRWAIYFYPERLDIIEKMHEAATEIGGQLEKPRLRRKYRWIQKIFGWKIAKKAQFSFPAVRSLLEENYEKLLCKIRI